MADVLAEAPGRPSRGARPGLLTRLALSPRFHALAARVPGLKHIARSEGRALFSIVSGFAQTQALLALVELGTLARLARAAEETAGLARAAGVPAERMAILLQAGAALRLIRRKGRDQWHLSPRGAALLTVPGLAAMVRHHPVLYRDLADPVAFLRGETRPELARFWPYVFGAGAAEDPGRADDYSRLMADSQGLVAEDTLRLADLSGAKVIMDVGGGTGAFLAAVAQAHPGASLRLFDLPAVLEGAAERLARQGLTGRVALCPGSFRDDPLPPGADVITLVRVLYDHADATVRALLKAVHDALPPGGRVVISEPMSGGARPDPATDVYFALYTLAMETGRTRSGVEIAALLHEAGFAGIRILPGFRPFITSAVTAFRPCAGGKEAEDQK